MSNEFEPQNKKILFFIQNSIFYKKNNNDKNSKKKSPFWPLKRFDFLARSNRAAPTHFIADFSGNFLSHKNKKIIIHFPFRIFVF